jgi:hypothetical protein
VNLETVLMTVSERRAEVARRRAAGDTPEAIADALHIGRATVYRDLAATTRLEPNKLAALRAACLDALASLRQSLRGKAESGDEAAIAMTTKIVELEVKLLIGAADATDWEATA